MDGEQTRALWAKGEEAWNSWALAALQSKELMEKEGGWLADWFGEGQNQATQGWLAEARADFSEINITGDASFQNFVFPGPTIFDGAHISGKALFTGARFAYVARFQAARFDAEATFKQAQFHHLTVFDEAVFTGAADFEKCEFLRESTGPLVPAARFQKAQLKSRAEFRGCKFTGHAEFVRVQFGGNARFDEAEFLADANFEGATFEGTAGLVKTRFQGAAKFDRAHFTCDARFGEAEFKGLAGFEDASFDGKSSFRTAKFGGETHFDSAGFEGDARFSDAQFTGAAHFRQASFESAAEFQKAAFASSADFAGACFNGETDFAGAILTRGADFSGSRFKGNVGFIDAAFQGGAKFLQVVFKGRASFRSARFAESAVFDGMQSKGAFVLSGGRFAEVPSFQETSFREPPSLDRIAIADSMRIFPRPSGDGKQDPRPLLLRGMKSCGSADIAARYRRLRQFAADTKDAEREREFFAQELRARRFFLDKPFGEGMARFWFGWLYGGVADFGRSFARPLFAWAVSIPIFALAYLAIRRMEGAAQMPLPTNTPAPPAWPQEANLQTIFAWMAEAFHWVAAYVRDVFSAGSCTVGDSGATAEAFFLSLKNALFFLGWESQDAARRVYACLYGYEGAPAAQMLRVPLSVSSTAILQNVVSAFLLFLMLIAFRNLLKTR